MSRVGDALKARFAGKRTRYVARELESVIPLDSRGEPAIYAAPFTLEDNGKFKHWIDQDSPEGFAHVIVQKAQDEAGERLFDIGDVAILMQCCEAYIVKTIATEIMASVHLEDAEGN